MFVEKLTRNAYAFGAMMALLCMVLFALPALAQDINPDKDDLREPAKIYSPYVERTVSNKNFAEGLYWGDTHLHTKYSTDAGMVGNKLSPDEAYRFAKGEEVIASTGQRTKLIRPLDFLVVADHAENLGLAPMIEEANPELLSTEYGRKWYDMVRSGQGYEAFREWATSVWQGDKIKSKKMTRKEISSEMCRRVTICFPMNMPVLHYRSVFNWNKSWGLILSSLA